MHAFQTLQARVLRCLTACHSASPQESLLTWIYHFEKSREHNSSVSFAIRKVTSSPILFRHLFFAVFPLAVTQLTTLQTYLQARAEQSRAAGPHIS